MKLVLLLAIVLLTGCATVSYVPPEGGTNQKAILLETTLVPRVLSLGLSKLSLVKRIEDHSDLPFLQDGGTYTTQTGGHYLFQSADGHETELLIITESEVRVNEGGSFSSSVSKQMVQVSLGRGGMAVSAVRREPGSDSYLELHAAQTTVVTLEFRGVSEGRAVTQWNQPTAFVFRRGSEVMGYLSLDQTPVFYGALGQSEEPEPAIAMAVLVAYECARGPFDPTLVTLPERLD